MSRLTEESKAETIRHYQTLVLRANAKCADLESMLRKTEADLAELRLRVLNHRVAQGILLGGIERAVYALDRRIPDVENAKCELEDLSR